jgi:hypothetical protein
MVDGPGASSDASPRNLLRTNPARRRRVVSGVSDHVPKRWAKAPPRSMSTTSTAEASACSTTRLLTRSGRLISAGLPAPSMTTSSWVAASRSYDAAIGGQRWGPRSPHGISVRSGRERPCTTTWLRVSASGFSSTGFMSTLGVTPAAMAWSHWATPISPPSTTRALLDMFWALNGATSTPRRANHRQSAVASRLLPAVEVQPSTISALVIGPARYRSPPLVPTCAACGAVRSSSGRAG